MIFNSVTYLIFLIIVVTLSWILKPSVRLWMLLLASCIFYGFWRWEFLFVMLASALTDYYTSLMIDSTPKENKKRRKILLAVTLIVNLGLLVYFKYLYFFSVNINSILELTGTVHRLPLYYVILPFGISFYTFETISYTVDVYRGLIKPEKKFLHYALFVTFFPKLVAGPIQRASELISQLNHKPKFDVNKIIHGFDRILVGLFLKVVLADNISPFVDEGFSMNINSVSALDVYTLAFLFGFQIYFDFSAYSHIAIGSAQLLGIKIPENFNFPYVAYSMKDFWKRWHISLSSWIRDYLYLPLAGVKVLRSTGEGGIGEGLESTRKVNKTRALFFTWIIMGLWHGANWTFVLWGFMHASFIFIERRFQSVSGKIPLVGNKFLGWLLTIFLIMLSWIPFRANSLDLSIRMYQKLLNLKSYTFLGMRENVYLVTFLIVFIFLLYYIIVEYFRTFWEKLPFISYVFGILKTAFIIVMVYTFLRPISQFIYFQF